MAYNSDIIDPSANTRRSIPQVSVWNDRFAFTLETLTMALLLGTICMTVFQVGLRFSTGKSIVVLDELSRWLFVWMVFMGVPASIARGESLKIDFFSNSLGVRMQGIHTLIVNSAIATTTFFLVVHGVDVASNAVFLSPALQWPTKVLEASIPICGILLLVAIFLNQSKTSEQFLAGIWPILIGGAIFALIRFGLGDADFGLSSTGMIVIVTMSLVFLAVPIGFAVICGSFMALQSQGDIMIGVVTQTLTSSINSFLLLAVPFFIVAAGIMNGGGITERLVRFATSLVGHFRGGLGYVNITTNTMMAGVSASSFADAAAVAKILGEPMTKQGYPRGFTAALTGSAAITANLIPPSLALILYAALANVSVGTLFIAGVIPGLLMALTLSAVVYIQSRRFGFGRGASSRATWSLRGHAFWVSIPALIVPFGVVGGLRAGMFTTTEAGAIAVVYALIVGLIAYRELPIKNILPIIRESSVQVSSILFVVAASGPLSWILVSEQAPQALAGWISNLTDNPIYVLLLLNGLLLCVGLFIEVVAAMIVLVPLLLPIAVAVGVDPTHFGIVIVVNLMLGSLTPPMGIMAFITAKVVDVPVIEVFKASVPFLIGLAVLLMLLTFIPAFSLFLPNLING